MKLIKKLNVIKILSFLGFTIFLSICSNTVLAASSIVGIVYDKQRNFLPDIEVELLNDYYQMISRTKTDNSGRYQFNNLNDGRYSVKVYAFRYDLEDQTLPVEIVTQNIRGGQGSGYFPLDFYLNPRKGGLAETEIGVVFAQEVPPEAKKKYEKGSEFLAKKKFNEGMMELNEAIKIFPDYYIALHRIGKEFFGLKNYREAIPFFLKASEVNTKSATNFYYVGVSLHNLGKEYNKAATTALKSALVLAPISPQILYMLGKIERSDKKFLEAEKHLIQAKKNSKVSIPEIHKELAQLYSDDIHKYSEAADELELFLKSGNIDKKSEEQIRKIIVGLREKSRNR